MSKKPRNASHAAAQWVRELTLSQGEKVLLFALASRIDDDYKANFSREVLMQDTGIKSRQSFAKHVESLSEKNLIRVGKHSHKGNKWPRNSYELMVPPKYKVKKMDPVGDAQILSVDAQILSVDAQKMDPNDTYYYTHNDTGEDKQSDEISDPASGSQPYEKFLQGESPEQEQILPSTKKIDFAGRFPVSSKFNHHKLSSKAKVAFWHSCIATYRPDNYKPEKGLTERQSIKLWELFGMFSHKPQAALAVIEWAVVHWDDITEAHKKKPWDKYGSPIDPTPTYIVNNHHVFTDHLLTVGKIKIL